MVENEGKSAPDEYLKMVIAQCGSSFGQASINEEGQIEIWRQAKGASMELLHELSENYGTRRRVSVFGKSDGLMAEEMVQPYSLVQVEGKEGATEDVCISFLDGEFNQCAKKESALAPAYFANEEVLTPLVQQLWKQTEGDANLFIDNLDIDDIHTEVTNLLSTSKTASAVFLATTLTPEAQKEQEPFRWTSGDAEKEYPWGWVSDNLGYVPKDDSVKPVTKGRQLVLKGKPDTSKPEETKPAETKPVVPEPGEGFEYVTPPGDVRGKDLEAWYKQRTPGGILPSKWHERPSIRVKKAAGSKMQAELTKGMRKLEQVPQKDSIPVISEAELATFETDFVKGRFKDMTGKSVDNPFKYKDFEARLPKFTEAMAGHGIKTISDVYSWPPIALQYLVEKCPMAATNLLMQLIETASNQTSELSKLTTAGSKADTDKGRPTLTLKKKTA